jgi:uncharacterized protein (TIGR00296 family)
LSFTLSIEEGIFLIKLVRQALVKNLKDGKIINYPGDVPSKFLEKRGIFVTINKIINGKKNLRGCIGFPYPNYPIIKAVIAAAIESATRDPRFPPVTLREIESIILEISILTLPELIETSSPIEYPSKIKIGENGLIVENGFYKGLLLPQVPVEWDWNEEEFLSQCCIKAGLSPDCWVLKKTKIYKFSCVITKELSPNGKVVVVDMRNTKNKI